MPIYVGTPTQNKKIKDIFVGMAGDVPVKVIEAWIDRGKIYDGRPAYFVACDSDGVLYYSINGVEWEKARPLFDNKPIHGVTYGLEKFVAVGSGGMVYYSDDGKLWESENISEQDLYDIVYGKDKFVTVGKNGAVYWSNDGINWKSANSVPKYNFRKITYGKGVYVAAAGSEYLYHSPDGVNWKISNSLGDTITRGVTFGNNKFIAVGNKGRTFYSNDGIAWQFGNTTNSKDTLAEIKYICHGMFITTGKNETNGVAYITTNGKQWQAIAGMENTTRLNSITSGPNPALEFGNYPIMAVMVGDDGVAYWCQGPNSLSTTYQENWQPCRGISTSANFYSVAYRSDGGHFRDE